MFNGHRSSRAALAALLLALAVACRPTPPTPKEPAVAATQVAAKPAPDQAVKPGGIAIIAHREDPPATWDPMFQTSISLAHVSGSVFGDGVLVRPCRDDLYKVCPALAESWENKPNFTQFTFKLRDNVFWHDGTKLTAEDIRWWVDLAYNGVKVGEKTRPASRFKAYFG